MPTARFDDLASGRSFVLSGELGSTTAHRLEDVIPALAWAQERSHAGQWVAGYVGYDAAPAFDRTLQARHRADVPYAWFGAFEAKAEIDPSVRTAPPGAYDMSRWSPMVDRESYDAAFAIVRDHIRMGDTYQVNLTFPMRAALSGDTDGLYDDLLDAQEAGFACQIVHDDIAVLSASPEQFFTIHDGEITTRPMKGTRRRGRWTGEDAQLKSDLATSEKDRAENLMIVDLIRNDLGRISTFGSVRVDDLFAIEGYRTVWQMTSEVSAALRSDVSLVDVFAALFPCGSVTGAPKTSAMAIIDAVEAHPRGLYCGAIGFIPPGNGLEGASFNVAIRTVVVHAAEGVGCYGVGGGITWDSDLDGEYDEALTKANLLTAPIFIPGVFTTMRWEEGWIWLDDHLARLAESCARFGLAFDAAALRQDLDAVAASFDGPMRVRVSVPRGDRPIVEATPVAGRFAMRSGPDTEVVRVGIDFDPVDASDLRLFHKTLDRSLYDVRRRRHPNWDDVILTNGRGMVTESSIANVAFLIDDQWVTPPVADGLLPGIMRKHLLEDGYVVERSVSVRDATTAHAVALFNAVRGWRPAALEAPATSESGSIH